MFRIRLVLVRSQTRWVFRVGRLFRVISSAAALGLLLAGFALDTLTVPIILASVALLSALYEESAVFDSASNRAEFRWGLLPLHRTKSFPLSDIAEIRLSTFGQAHFTSLEVGMADGAVLTIENDKGKTSAERLTGWGQELAQWLKRPLTT